MTAHMTWMLEDCEIALTEWIVRQRGGTWQHCGTWQHSGAFLWIFAYESLFLSFRGNTPPFRGIMTRKTVGKFSA